MSLSDDLSADIGDLLAMQPPEDTKKAPVTCTIEYALLPKHLADYVDASGKLPSTTKSDEKDIKSLRSKHHGVARLLAEGVPEGVVAEMTGYTKAYISTLKNNPSMSELIAFYRGPKNEAAKLIGERLRTIAGMSVERLEERLERDELNATELTAVAKLGFDRSGHGPQSTVNSVTEHRILGLEELAELSRRARQRDSDLIIDPEFVRNVLPAPDEESSS